MARFMNGGGSLRAFESARPVNRENFPLQTRNVVTEGVANTIAAECYAGNRHTIAIERSSLTVRVYEHYGQAARAAWFRSHATKSDRRQYRRFAM
jgi:hypothetical protein